MGLTINYTLTSRTRSAEKAKELVEQMRQLARQGQSEGLGDWLFVQLVGTCIGLLGAGLGCDSGFAVVAGFFIAIGLTVHALTRSNQ